MVVAQAVAERVAAAAGVAAMAAEERVQGARVVASLGVI